MAMDAEKLTSKKKVVEETAATAASSWSTEGYNPFISLIFISMLVVLTLYIDMFAICVLHAYVINTDMLMIYLWINSIKHC